MCHHNAFVTLCHKDSFNCNPFIFLASFIYSDASELEAIHKRHFDMGGAVKCPTLGPLGKDKCQPPCGDRTAQTIIC